MEIYIATGIKQLGPHSTTEILDLIQREEVVKTDLAWYEGLSDWVSLEEILNDTIIPSETANTTNLISISGSTEITVNDPQASAICAAESKIVPPPRPVKSSSPPSFPSRPSPGMVSKNCTENDANKVTAVPLGNKIFLFFGSFAVVLTVAVLLHYAGIPKSVITIPGIMAMKLLTKKCWE